MRLPLSSTRPGPTDRTEPSWGFSLAVSGKTIPLAVTSSFGLALTTTRSPNGLRLTLIESSPLSSTSGRGADRIHPFRQVVQRAGAHTELDARRRALRDPLHGHGHASPARAVGGDQPSHP